MLPFKYVLAHLGAFATIVFISTIVGLLLTPIHKTETSCLTIELDTFYNDIILELTSPLVCMVVLLVACTLCVAVAVHYCEFRENVYAYMTAGFLWGTLSITIPIVVLSVNHALYHTVSQLAKAHHCKINHIFTHEVIVPFATLALLQGILTSLYCILYLLIYDQNMSFNNDFSQQTHVNENYSEQNLNGDSDVEIELDRDI